MVGHVRSRAGVVLAIVAVAIAAACSKSSPPSQSSGSGTGESITGREQLGWDQPASGTTELAALRYAIYVDGARAELADVSCATAVGPAGYTCSGRLPAMTNGAHVLELAAYLDAGAIVEGARSTPFRVMVTGSAS